MIKAQGNFEQVVQYMSICLCLSLGFAKCVCSVHTMFIGKVMPFYATEISQHMRQYGEEEEEEEEKEE